MSAIKAKLKLCPLCQAWRKPGGWHNCPHGNRCHVQRFVHRPECRGCQLKAKTP